MIISYFILGVAVLLAVILLSRWYVSTSPQTLSKALKWVVFTVFVMGVMWLVVTGKLWAALAALPAILMWFMRIFTGLRYAQIFARLFGSGRGAQGWSNPSAGENPGTGQSSDVYTRFVSMHLDHASGHVSGQVLEGRFAGRALESLSIAELLDLYHEAQADADSARVIEGFLDRRDPNWRHQSQTQNTDPGTMNWDEALRVLGLDAGASPEEIKAAHRRLMATAHPDKGGSDYLAQQINRAKDVLLNK